MSTLRPRAGIPSGTSLRGLLWRVTLGLLLPLAASAQEPIILSDIVGGGDGRGTAPPANVGINSDTGLFEQAHNNANVTDTDGFNPAEVPDSAAINSVFIIDQPTMPITAGTDVTFDFDAGDATGDTWSHIIKDVTHDIDKDITDIWAGGVSTWETCVGIHASAGITFELDELRSEFGDESVKIFSCFAGTDQCNGNINLYAIVSDEVEVLDFRKATALGANQGDGFFIEIPDEAVFLTLAVGGQDGSIGCAHGVFAEPVISALPPFRTLTSPSNPDTCPPTLGGPASGLIQQNLVGDAAEAITVIEKLAGPFGPDEITTDPAASEITPLFDNTQGFVQSWLLLGPFEQAGGAAPGVDNIRLDYLTDGAETEINTEPSPGETITTDYDLAASTALAATTNQDTINPGGVPTWNLWEDPDDTINFDDYYGGNVDQIMMYAVIYLDVPADIPDVTVAVARDDAMQVLIDGVEVLIHDAGQGYGGARSIQQREAIGTLTQGLHKVMVKVFEGGGGHGFRLRFEDSAMTGLTFANSGISLCRDPDASDCSPLSPDFPAGAEVTWETTRGALDAGITYEVDLAGGTVVATGRVDDTPIAGDGTATVLAQGQPILTDLDLEGDGTPEFSFAHAIGAECPGTGFDVPGDGTLTIRGAGADIWTGGDQAMFAYQPVTGNFSARVTVKNRNFAPGSRWGKHGIMARQDCSPRSRYTFIHDQGEDLQDTTRMAQRPTHLGADNFETVPTTFTGLAEHANTLRLDRVGNLFTTYIWDENGSFSGESCVWLEIGTHDWGADAPETVNVGLIVTSHQACDVTEITFEDWELVEGGDVSTPRCTPPVSNVSCVLTGDGGLQVTWENDPAADTGDPILILVNGEQETSVPGDATSANVPSESIADGITTVGISNFNGEGRTISCTVFSGTELYINSGGARLDPAFGTEVGDGRIWEEDTLANPSPFLTSANANTADFAFPQDALGVETTDLTLVEPEWSDVEGRLFSTERWADGPVEYTIPVPRCDYEVFLLFAEGCCSNGCEDLFDPTFSFIDDGTGAALPCRVVDVFVNDELVEDQFSQHLEVSRSLDLVIPNSNWGIALVTGPYEVFDTDVIKVLIDDLGPGAIPENASIKGVALRTVDPAGCDSAGPVFLRGDVDGNGILEITDVVNDLAFQFLGQYTPICLDAHDFDDNGLNEITDAVNSLGHQFLGDPPPPAPGTQTCGLDPTDDGLDCAAYPVEMGCAK